MNILVINSGSSSLKYQLVNMEGESVTASGVIERIGEEMGSITQRSHPDKWPDAKSEEKRPVLNHDAAMRLMVEKLTGEEWGVIDSLSDIDAIGHRVVQGGESFAAPGPGGRGRGGDHPRQHPPGPAARRQPGGHRGRPGTVSRHAQRDRVRHRISPDHPAQGAPLPDPLRIVRGAPHPQVRLPRHLPQVRGPGRRRIPGQALRRHGPDHRAPGQRLLHGRREAGPVRGHHHGADPPGRVDDGHPAAATWTPRSFRSSRAPRSSA